MEVPGPTALKMEANVLIMGAENVGKSGKNRLTVSWEQGVPQAGRPTSLRKKGLNSLQQRLENKRQRAAPQSKLVRWG